MTARPTDCDLCRDRFMASEVTQAEMRMIAVREGPKAAESALNERYMEWHDSEHGEVGNDWDEWCQGCNHAIDSPCEIHG